VGQAVFVDDAKERSMDYGFMKITTVTAAQTTTKHGIFTFSKRLQTGCLFHPLPSYHKT